MTNKSFRITKSKRHCKDDSSNDDEMVANNVKIIHDDSTETYRKTLQYFNDDMMFTR